MQSPQNQFQEVESISIPNNQNNPTSVNTSQAAQQSNQANPLIYQTYSPKIIVSPYPYSPAVVKEKPKRVIRAPIKLSPESITTVCPFCEETINTVVEKNYNIKAILTAIGTCFVGFACLQACNNKKIGFHDSIHSCPNCKGNIGTYNVI